MRCGVLGDMVIDPLTVVMCDYNMWNLVTFVIIGTCHCSGLTAMKQT